MTKRYCDRCGQQIDEGVHAWYVLELHGTDGEFRHKELCEECYELLAEDNYIPRIEQTEPQTDCGDFADRLAYERGVKHAWEVAQKVFDSTLTFYEAEDLAKQIDKDINVRSKDCETCKHYKLACELFSEICKYEPTTQTETQNSNLTFKTLEYCNICDHKGCEECISNALDEHCMPSQFNKQIEDECAKEYEELGLKELKELIKADRKTEPTISKMEQVEEPQTEYERASEQREHDILYEPTYNPEDGSM